jgi:glutamyl-Q tRNA(Asp) synthetase
VAAVAAYLDARANRGQWLIRMEDVDTARCSSHWADDILRILEAFAFHWDRPVVYQTSPERQHAYESALHRLDDAGLVYPCACSRKQIAETQSTVDADGEIRYPGTCRNGLPPGALPRAWRVRVPDETIGFTDRVQGRFEQHLALSVGDFVLRRADGPFAYQLAVVVDDADQGITDVVRGVDLLASTPRQIYLQRLLRLPQPRYLHLPLVLTNDGEKLSKQTGAPPLRLDNPGHQLWEALDFLGQSPPANLKDARPEALWQWGIAAWNVGKIPTPPL